MEHGFQIKLECRKFLCFWYTHKVVNKRHYKYKDYLESRKADLIELAEKYNKDKTFDEVLYEENI